MAYADYLDARQVEKLARGGSVKVTIDGERKRISGSRIKCNNCGNCPS